MDVAQVAHTTSFVAPLSIRFRGWFYEAPPAACVRIFWVRGLTLSGTIWFISTMDTDPWGGSEELWTRTATLLARQGIPVAASVHGWPVLDRRITALSRAGIDLHPRPIKPSIAQRVRRSVRGQAPMVFDIERAVGKTSVALVVMSTGYFVPPIELVEMCLARNWPFVTLARCNSTSWWIPDALAARFRKALPLARRCFFASEANRALAERQLGCALVGAGILNTPITIATDSPIPWPSFSPDQELRMACVGRLSLQSKGQDVLLDALTGQGWRERNWRLTFYGNGPNREVLASMIERLELQHKVFFGGHVAVEDIWSKNHVLVMPSRYEGTPMAVVEAMFCGRPVVATDVGGNAEVIEDDVTGFIAAAPAPACFSQALERMWMSRHRLHEMGQRAAASIREFWQKDPVGTFAEDLKSLAGLKKSP